MNYNDEVKVARGADLTVKISLIDENNVTIDATLLAKLVVTVNHLNGTPIAKYSKNAATGYQLIDMTNAASGEILIRLLSTHTQNSPEGVLIYEVHGQYTSTSISDDGVLDIIRTGEYLCTIIKSVTGAITLP